MPRDTIDRAIKRGSGGDADANYDEVRYEGYGPGGVAVIVEALTDNRNRTAGEVRSSFTKHGGDLGETNSVAFMFDRVGEIRFPRSGRQADDDAGGGDRGRRGRRGDERRRGGRHEINCAPGEFRRGARGAREVAWPAAERPS